MLGLIIEVAKSIRYKKTYKICFYVEKKYKEICKYEIKLLV